MDARVKIAVANGSDAHELASLDKLAHQEDEEWGLRTRSEFLAITESHTKSILLARLRGKLVGYAYVKLKRSRKGLFLWIEDVYVLEQFRKKHVAKRLIETAINLWKPKIRHASLLTSNKNVKIFSKLGFRRVMNYMSFRLRENSQHDD